MSDFLTPKLKLQEWLTSESTHLIVHGSTNAQWLFLYSKFLENEQYSKKNHVFIFKNNEDAEKYFDYFNQILPAKYFYALDYSLYDHVIHSDIQILEKFDLLINVINSKQNFIFTTYEALAQKLPNVDFFQSSAFSLNKEDIISHDDLIKKLNLLGYVRAETCEEPGTFSKKGEIFDIYPIGFSPIRLHFFDELIEFIKLVDKDTQRTINDSNLDQVIIYPTPQFIFTEKFKNNLRSNIPQFGPDQKEKFEKRKSIFDKINSNQVFEQFSILFPLFFNEHSNLLDYLKGNFVLNIFEPEQCSTFWETKFESLLEEFKNLEGSNSNIVPHPSFYFDLQTILKIKQYKTLHINPFNIDFNVQLIDKLDLNFLS